MRLNPQSTLAESITALHCLADTMRFMSECSEVDSYGESQRWKNRADGIERAIRVLQGLDEVHQVNRPEVAAKEQ